MLVCSVSLRSLRRAIGAELVETAAAADAPGSGNIVFATLVDDPASVADFIDAYLGEIMLEAASAADNISAGASYDTAIDDALTAASVEDATTTSAPVFTTWNSSDRTNVTLTNGNLTAAASGTPGGVRGVHSHTSGKYYWEYKYDAIQSNAMANGIALASASLTSSTMTGTAVMNRLGAIFVNNTNTGISLSTRAVNDVIGIAVDFGAQLIWFRVVPAGNWNNSGAANPATGTGGINISTVSTGALFPAFIVLTNLDKVTANFGASSFSGAVPSGFTSGFTS